MTRHCPPRPSRRRVLAAGGGLVGTALAGCLGTDRPATGTATDTPASTGTPGPATGGPYRFVEADLVETTADAVARGVLRGTEHLDVYEDDLIAQAIDTGTASFTTINYDPLAERIYVHRNGAYYRLTRSVTDRTSVTAPAIQVEAVSTCHGETPTVSETPVPLSDLPPTDRRVLLVGIRDHYETDACFTFSDRIVAYSADARRDSVLVGESPTFVRYRDDVYLARYEGTETRTRKIFEFEAEELGTSLEAYADAVVPEVVWHVDPVALPPAEREFFATLREQSHYEKENPIPEYVLQFLYRAKREAYSRLGPYFLEHDGAYYRLAYAEAVS